MGLAHFSIGTATNRLDLTRNLKAIDWEPSQTPLEPTWASSALAEGRQPTSHRFTNAIESMTLHIVASSQDKVIEWSQELRRMLIKATEYWDTDYQPDIVYVAARASCETNMRYCWVYGGEVPKDNDPYGQPFTGRGAPSFWERQLVFERGAWMANAPGVGTSIAVEATQEWCFPSYLEFDGIDDNVNCASDAKLDNLPGFAVYAKGPITVEAWIRPTGWGESSTGRIASKADWEFMVWDLQGLNATVTCVTRQARSNITLAQFSPDGAWHHVLMTYSETGAGLPAARTIYIAVDGVWATVYNEQQTSQGNYVTDAAENLWIGDRTANDRCFEGDIGSVRVSNSIRHSPAGGDFTPPDRCKLPDIDANTMGQWIYEGTGATTANQSGGTAGAITNATWDCDCPHTFGYVPPVPGAPAPGWWDPAGEGLVPWGAWQAKDAANFAGSLVELSGTARNLGDPGGANTPGWTAAGWSFDGINDYLTTTFIPANDQSQTMLVQFTGWVDIAGNNYLAGSYTLANSYFTLAPDNANIVFVGNGQNRWIFAISFANGNLGVAGAQGYKNGAAIGAITGYTVAPTHAVYLGCFNNAGAAAGFAQVKIRAFVIYPDVLTAGQMLSVANAMAAI